METLSCSCVVGAMELFDVPGIMILLLTLYWIGRLEYIQVCGRLAEVVWLR